MLVEKVYNKRGVNMQIKNDDNEIILNTESLLLYDVTASIEAKLMVIINGKCMSVKEFKEDKSDPRKGKFGRKAINEMDNI